MAKDLVRTRRYIQKFYEMKTQLQAVSLRIQVKMNLFFLYYRKILLRLLRYCNTSRQNISIHLFIF